MSPVPLAARGPPGSGVSARFRPNARKPRKVPTKLGCGCGGATESGSRTGGTDRGRAGGGVTGGGGDTTDGGDSTEGAETPCGGAAAGPGPGLAEGRPERSVPWNARDLACETSSSGGSLSDCCRTLLTARGCSAGPRCRASWSSASARAFGGPAAPDVMRSRCCARALAPRVRANARRSAASLPMIAISCRTGPGFESARVLSSRRLQPASEATAASRRPGSRSGAPAHPPQPCRSIDLLHTTRASARTLPALVRVRAGARAQRRRKPSASCPAAAQAVRVLPSGGASRPRPGGVTRHPNGLRPLWQA